MSSVPSVHYRPDCTTLAGVHHARVQIIRADPFGAFNRAVLRQSPRRITIVSPWASDTGERLVGLSRLVRHAEHHDSAVVLVTRPPASEAHEHAVQVVRGASRGCVHFNPRLHAKLYVCEYGDGQGFAVIGSANSSAASVSLDEIALLVRPEKGSKVITELAGQTVRGLLTNRPLGR